MNEIKIIDCHAHVFPNELAPKAVENLENYYKMKWSCTGTVSDILNSMAKAGIYKSIVLSTPTKPTQVENTNKFLSELCSDSLICFGSVHPDYEDFAGEINRIKQNGLKGFKFHPEFQNFKLDSEKMLKIYENIGTDYPILIHTGDEVSDNSSPKRLARVLEIFPKHTFIAAHLGGYSKWDESKKYLIGKNLYIDTSSSMCRLSLKETAEIIRMHGVDKVLFGTDYPAVSHEEELTQFLALDLTEEEKVKILSTNAMKLFKIE